MLYLKETRSAFLRLWVWEVSPESRVLGPRSMSFKERGGFQRNSRQALEHRVQSAHRSYSRRDRRRGQADTGPGLEGCGQKSHHCLVPTAEVLERQLLFFSPSKQEVPPSLQRGNEMRSFVRKH